MLKQCYDISQQDISFEWTSHFVYVDSTVKFNVEAMLNFG